MAANNKHFCVIGAGASGIAAIKGCVEYGAQVTCFERTDSIGGLWHYTEDVTEKASVAKSTVINTSKEYMAYSDFLVPAEYPNYMRHDKILSYFNQYVDNFDLRKYIKFNTAVSKVDYAPDYDSTGRWSVTRRNLDTGNEETTDFDGVMVCSGHHAQPHIPKLKGLDTFKGKVTHTHDYKRGDVFVDKNILVVGIGNSGGDAAVETCRYAKSVHISTRHGTWCVPRSMPNGMPIDSGLNRFLVEILNRLPFWLTDWFLEHFFIRVDHDLLGLRPNYGPSGQHAMVNDDFPNRILSGLIKIQPDIKKFGPNSVTFVDGTTADNLDAVVLATGYIIGFPFISPSIVSVNSNKVDLYRMIFPPNLKHPTLAIIGCIQPVGAIMPISEIQARWAVRVFSGEKKLPSREQQYAEIAERRRLMAERYVASQRHTIQVDGLTYMDEIASELGCMPSFTGMLLTCDCRLALACIFGMIVPYQYRLNGPNAWPGARDAILTVNERVLRPLTTHISKTWEPKMDRGESKKDQ